MNVCVWQGGVLWKHIADIQKWNIVLILQLSISDFEGSMHIK